MYDIQLDLQWPAPPTQQHGGINICKLQQVMSCQSWMQAQAYAKLAELQEQEEERIAACIDRQNREHLLRAKSSQKLREQSTELRKLQQQIETAAVVMGRELQLQEKQMLAEREQAYNDAFDAMLAQNRAKASLPLCSPETLFSVAMALQRALTVHEIHPYGMSS